MESWINKYEKEVPNQRLFSSPRTQSDPMQSL